MTVSVFQLFSIGIGPSSSHTVGPMRAARQFVMNLESKGYLKSSFRVQVELYGSLALTGKGHGTDIAIMLGLEGIKPEEVDPEQIPVKIRSIQEKKIITLNGSNEISFEEERDLLFHYGKHLPYHPNGMRFKAYDNSEKELIEEVWYSIGGGFIVNHAEIGRNDPKIELPPYPFENAEELLQLCRFHKMQIHEIMQNNEKKWHSAEEIRSQLLLIWTTMKACIARGCVREGILPGGLGVKRRAPRLYQTLTSREKAPQKNPAEIMEWVSVWALAVNEENAAGGKVVTAPTNGASGVIPSVLQYYEKWIEGANDEGVIAFLLTAGAMGILFKKGASISAAEMGCMGEVGVACSMAAAGLTAAMGGTPEQIENAAEIGMEHHLGLTCDPIKGLVQIPCIERNTMGAIQAINASLLAMQGDGSHRVSLDQVIATMRQTGRDMKSIYKETSQGGLAVNVPEC